MKYILFIFFLVSNLFAITCNTMKFTYQDVTPSSQYLGSKLYCDAIYGNSWTNSPDTNPCKMVNMKVTTTTITSGSCPTQPVIPTGTGGSACYVVYTTNPISFKCNSKPTDNVSPSLRCDQAYISTVDGTVKACNPNTNIPTVIENAIGGTFDESGSLQVTCAKGYAPDYLTSMGDSIPYDIVSCIVEPEKVEEPVIIIKPDGEKVVTNPDGSTVITKTDGTIVSTDKDGIISTSYPNGSGSISGSYGDANGTSAIDNTSNDIIIDKSIGANTPLESSSTGSIDYVPITVASFCGDPTMTLEQKNLCEINQGIKNLNSESSPSNSTANILKDINQDNNANASAINQNIKYGNDNLDLINKNTIASNHNTANIVKGVAKQTDIAEQQLAQDKLNGKTLESIDITTKKILDNSDFFKSSINDAFFDDDTNVVKLHSSVQTMKDNQGLIMSTVENITDAFNSATGNYEALKAKLEGKTLENSFSVPQAVNLPVINLRVFGIDTQMTCFFNQDLYALFSGIRPFITFMLNVYFVYASIKIYFNLVTRLS